MVPTPLNLKEIKIYTEKLKLVQKALVFKGILKMIEL